MRGKVAGFFAVAGVAFLPAVVAAQQGTGSITGSVAVGTCARNGVGVRIENINGGLEKIVRTNADGTFQIYGLRAGSYTVSPDLDAFRETRRQTIELRENGNGLANFELGIELYGTLSCNGEPYSNSAVQVRLINDSAADRNACMRSGETNSDGGYAIPRLAAGTYEVTVRRGFDRAVEVGVVELGRTEWHSHDIVWCQPSLGSDFRYTPWERVGTTWAR